MLTTLLFGGGGTAVGGIDADKLSHMEWCSIFEPNMSTDVATQAQRQVLIGGYHGVLWDAKPQNPGGGVPLYVTYTWMWDKYHYQ